MKQFLLIQTLRTFSCALYVPILFKNYKPIIICIQLFLVNPWPFSQFCDFIIALLSYIFPILEVDPCNSQSALLIFSQAIIESFTVLQSSFDVIFLAKVIVSD